MTTRNLFTILMIYFIIKIHKCINYTYDVIYILMGYIILLKYVKVSIMYNNTIIR